MNISKRLSRLAAMVTEGSRLADVGTDHGYVPLCLYRQGRIPSAIAMDINEGPLERARAHIREAGLEHYIETRLSDGLHALRAGEADTVLIAGMGGGLTERILTDGKGVLETVRELVLQPQSEIWRVRRFLCENGWRIVCEDIVLDEGKYYPMFRAVKGQAEPYGPGELLYGKSACQRSPEVMLEFLGKRLQNARQIQGARGSKDPETPGRTGGGNPSSGADAFGVCLRRGAGTGFRLVKRGRKCHMKCQEIIKRIEKRYPREYACDWDNPGRETGSRRWTRSTSRWTPPTRSSKRPSLPGPSFS